MHERIVFSSCYFVILFIHKAEIVHCLECGIILNILLAQVSSTLQVPTRVTLANGRAMILVEPLVTSTKSSIPLTSALSISRSKKQCTNPTVRILDHYFFQSLEVGFFLFFILIYYVH